MANRAPTSWRLLALGATLGLGGAVLSALPAVLALEQTVGLGGLFAAAPRPQPSDDVVVVAISRTTFEALGLPDELDEWPRSVHGALVDRLASAGAAVIVFDLVFSELRETRPDAELAAAIARAGNVLLLERTIEPRQAGPVERAGISLERREPPAAIFKQAALGSAPFTLPGVPIRLSQFWVFDRIGTNLPNLPALAAYAHAVASGVDFPELVARAGAGRRAASPAREGEAGLEREMQQLRDLLERDPGLAERLRMLVAGPGFDREARDRALALIELFAGPTSGYLRYYGGQGSVATVRYEDAVSGDLGALAQQVAGRAVFIGLSEAIQSEQIDDFYTVYSEGGRNVSGVEIGATATGNLLRSELVAPLAIPAQLGLLAAWGLIVAALALMRRQRLALLWLGIAGIAYFGVAVLSFAVWQVWIPLFVPLALQLPFALMLGAMLKTVLERRRRRRVGAALASYVPAAAIEQVDRIPISRDARRELVDGVCLVSDAHRYTELAERLHPEQLAELMNQYYELLFGIVERHDGIVTDTAGDSMVAIWRQDGPPSAQESACAAALAIQAALAEFNRAQGENRLVTSIGLDGGQMLMTNVGSGRRFSYRAVGDTVNTAARLQSLSRHLGSAVLVSEAAIATAPTFAVRPIGRFRLAGKSRALELYELYRAEGARLEPEALAAFAAGLERFRAGDWQHASERFAELLERDSRDGAAQFYVEQCARRGSEPTAPDWDGAVVWLQK